MISRVRPKHPNKHIEEAVSYAENIGWIYKKSGNSSHCWGHLLCPCCSRNGCIIQVYSTPKVPENHAKHIRRVINKCCHNGEK